MNAFKRAEIIELIRGIISKTAPKIISSLVVIKNSSFPRGNELIALSSVAAVSPDGSDLLSLAFKAYVTWAAGFHPVTFDFLLRLDLMVGLALGLCFYAFVHQRREFWVQAGLAVVGIFGGAIIPISWISLTQPVIKAFVVTVLLALMLVWPRIVPFTFVHRWGDQQRWQMVAWVVLVCLIVMNLALKEGL